MRRRQELAMFIEAWNGPLATEPGNGNFGNVVELCRVWASIMIVFDFDKFGSCVEVWQVWQFCCCCAFVWMLGNFVGF